MNTPLPTVSALLSETWNQFKTTWNDSTKVSIWMLYIGLANFAMSLIQKVAPDARIYFFPIDIALAILSMWVGIRITQAMLDVEDKKKIDNTPETQRKAWSFVLPTIWVGFLQSLIILGGFLLLIIPGIYLAIALTFAQYFVLTHNKRGVAALSASYELVKGRWLQAFWRLFAGGMIIGLGIIILMMAAIFLVGLIAGPEQFLSGMQDPNQNEDLVAGVIKPVQAMIMTAVLPLSALYGVKVFRTMEKTR